MFAERRIPFSVCLSLIVHGLLFGFALLPDIFPKDMIKMGTSAHKFKVSRIKSESPLESNLISPKAPQPKITPVPQINKKRDLSLKDLAASFDSVSTSQAAPSKKPTNDKPGLRSNSGNGINYLGKSVKQDLKMSQMNLIPPAVRQQLQNTFSSIQVDRESADTDELNKDELVFYSFFNRVGEAYLHAFVEEINAYQKRYPSKKYSLPFPEEPTEVMAEITYDENGDILRIKTLRWSDVGYFQDFFMNVMQALDALPNPPDELIKPDGTFSIKYSLKIKI
tara:strand:- start:8753 stop:9592 length:840 start_codon:yes stop_codon:yes gene_type:complete